MIKNGSAEILNKVCFGVFSSLFPSHIPPFHSHSAIVRAYMRVQHKEGGMGMEAAVGERALMALQ